MDEDNEVGRPEPLHLTGSEARMLVLIEEIEEKRRAREAERKPLTNDELFQLREILAWWMSLRALGKFSIMAGETLRWGGWLFAGYIAWKTGALAPFLGGK